MNTRKILIMLFLMLAILLLGTTISYGSYSAGNKTVNSGESFSITVTSSTALEAYNLDLSSYGDLTFKSCSKSQDGAIIEIQGGSIGYISTSTTTTSLGTYNFTAPKVSKDTTYTVKFLVNQETTVTSTVTVKASAQGNPNPPATNPGTQKSNNANLSNFGIRPNDFTGFRAANTSYRQEVPNEVESIEVYAEKAQSGQKITGTGRKTLQVGENKFDVTVTAEDGTTKTYSVTVIRSSEKSKSSNANLSNLGIKPNDFTGFKTGTTEYSVSVPNDVEKIEVYASKAENAQTIEGTGIKTLNEGTNKFDVTVTAENGNKKTYSITVIRLAKEEQENPSIDPNEKIEVALASLEIENVTLNEPFNPEKLEYTALANDKAEKVIVRATSNVESAKIQVTGAEEYEEGENVIRVTVTSEDGESSKTYKITVTKNEEEILGVTEENTLPVVGSVQNSDTDGNGGIGIEKIIFVSVIVLVTIAGIVLAVIYYRKDKAYEENYFSEGINFANTFDPKEAIKDTVSATSKLTSTNIEPEIEEGYSSKKNRGRHF